MGVDFLDIMYRLEKELGIRFEREDFIFTPAPIVTLTISVGEFYDLVEQKVCKASREILDSPDYWEKTFNEVRHVFAEGLGFPESERWTKETTMRELYELIPEETRKKTWSNFKKEHSCWWSKHGEIISSMIWYINQKYHCIFGLVWMGYIFFVIILPLMLGQWLFQAGFLTTAVLFLPGSLIWLHFWNRYCDYHRDMIRLDMTLGKITDQVILCRKKILKANGSPYTREEIEAIVKAALCAALAVKPEEVTPEKDLVRDLGME